MRRLMQLTLSQRAAPAPQKHPKHFLALRRANIVAVWDCTCSAAWLNSRKAAKMLRALLPNQVLFPKETKTMLLRSV